MVYYAINVYVLYGCTVYTVRGTVWQSGKNRAYGPTFLFHFILGAAACRERGFYCTLTTIACCCSTSSTMSDWAGREPLEDALAGVCAQTPPSQSAMKAAIGTAIKYSSEYKHLVHFVFRFFAGCDTNEKLCVVYLIDAVLRHYKKQGSDLGNRIVSRFQTRITDAFSPFRSSTSSLKRRLVKVWEAWKKRAIFDQKTLDEIAHAGDIFEERSKTNPPPQVSADDVLGVLDHQPSTTSALPPGGMYAAGGPPPLPQQRQYQNTSGYQNPGVGASPYPPPNGLQGGSQTNTRWGAAPSNASVPQMSGTNVTTLGQKRPREDTGDIVPGKIFFGGIHADTVNSELQEYFSQFGELTSCYIVMDRGTGRHKGYGFGMFADPASVEKVLAQQQHFSHGKQFEVKQCLKPGASVPATRARPKNPCFAWKRGECNQGDACVYSHDAPEGTSIGSMGPKKPCHNYKEGRCKFGDNCRYSHDGTPKQQSLVKQAGNSGYNFRPSAQQPHKTTGSNTVPMKFVRSFGQPSTIASSGNSEKSAATPSAIQSVAQRPLQTAPQVPIPTFNQSVGAHPPSEATQYSIPQANPPPVSAPPTKPPAPQPSAMPTLNSTSMPPPEPLQVEPMPLAVAFQAGPAKKGKGNPFKKRKKTKKKAAAEDLFDL